jgi:hypothetical protein
MQGMFWSEPMKRELRRAFRAGKYAAALRAFPNLTRGQVQSAIRRFVFDYETYALQVTAIEWMTPEEARVHLAAYDSAAFLDGVARLLEDRHGTPHHHRATRVA